jgi:hypothetical protein
MTLFATHYFELTQLPEKMEGVANVHLDALEHGDTIAFMHTVQDGAASKSYGLAVAALAGVPKEVIKRARQKLRELESLSPNAAATQVDGTQMSLLMPAEETSPWKRWKSRPGFSDAASGAGVDLSVEESGLVLCGYCPVALPYRPTGFVGPVSAAATGFFTAAAEWSAPAVPRQYPSASFGTLPDSAHGWYGAAVRYRARYTDNAGTGKQSRPLHRGCRHHFNMLIGTTWTNHLFLLIGVLPASRSVFQPRLWFQVNPVPAGYSGHGCPVRQAWWHR